MHWCTVAQPLSFEVVPRKGRYYTVKPCISRSSKVNPGSPQSEPIATSSEADTVSRDASRHCCSCRRRALELVYALVNETNIKALTKELLEYLKVSDAEFKPDLTSKICMLVQRFAPDKQWHLDSLLQVICCFKLARTPVSALSFVISGDCLLLVFVLIDVCRQQHYLHKWLTSAGYAACLKCYAV